MVLMFRSHRLRDCFSDKDLARIRGAVEDAEAATIGEIRVKIVADLRAPKLNGKLSREDRQSIKNLEEICRRGETRAFAQWHFFAEGLHNTRERTGVLILLILKRRRVEILADVGISSKTSQETWDQIVASLSLAFRSGAFTGGLVAAVQKVGALLREHFPMRPGDTNELSDAPILEEE